MFTWKIRCSFTVKHPMNKSSCWTYADFAAISFRCTCFPLRHTQPEILTLRRFLQVIQFIKVVFPDPLGPKITNNSAGWATPLTEKLFLQFCTNNSATWINVLNEEVAHGNSEMSYLWNSWVWSMITYHFSIYVFLRKVDKCPLATY